jgi:hypothetical protein
MTPEARIVEAIKSHPWDVRDNLDGSKTGVCLGCIKDGECVTFRTWQAFAEHLTAVITSLPDTTVLDRIDVLSWCWAAEKAEHALAAETTKETS